MFTEPASTEAPIENLCGSQFSMCDSNDDCCDDMTCQEEYGMKVCLPPKPATTAAPTPAATEAPTTTEAPAPACWTAPKSGGPGMYTQDLEKE